MNILLVDDHELFRDGLKLVLADLDASLVFFEAGNCAEALSLVAGQTMDLILLDFHMPGVAGSAALVTLRAAAPSARIVVVSAEDDPALIHQIIDSGASGFISKSSSHRILKAALSLVQAGGVYLPPAAYATPVAAPIAPLNTQELARISPRQLEIVNKAIQGKCNKIIARELDIAEATVKAHLSAAYRTLGVKNRTEAVFAAARVTLPA